MTKKLLVIWGDMLGGTVKALTNNEKPRPAFIPFRDNLALGPLLPLDDLDAFLSARAAYWSTRDPLGEASPAETLADLRKPIERLEAGLSEADVCEVWLGASTGEQFLAAFLVGLCEAGILDGEKIVFRQFACEDGRPSLSYYPAAFFQNLPEPLQLSALRIPYLSAWAALTAPDPTRLREIVARGPGLSEIDVALQAFHQRYPDEVTSLGSIDRALLVHARREWGPSAHAIGNAMSLGVRTPDQVGDGILFAHLKALGTGPQPLFDLRGKQDAIRNCEARLNRFGADCLAGRANRLANGIDEWIGGVHLDSSSGQVWVRRGGDILPI